MLEDEFFAQYDTSYAVDGCGHDVAVEAADIFVSVGRIGVALIFVQPEIELHPVLHYAAVKRREQDVVVIVELGHGRDEQTVIFACVAIDKCRAAVGARTVGTEQLFLHHSLKVGHGGPFKLQITHK